MLFATLHDFIQSDSALVARIVAVAAALAFVGGDVLRILGRETDIDEALAGTSRRCPTLFADSPHQTLRADQMDRGRHQKRLDSHVHEPVDGGGASLVWSVESTR